jgi:hypothetical protein
MQSVALAPSTTLLHASTSTMFVIDAQQTLSVSQAVLDAGALEHANANRTGPPVGNNPRLLLTQSPRIGIQKLGSTIATRMSIRGALALRRKKSASLRVFTPTWRALRTTLSFDALQK